MEERQDQVARRGTSWWTTPRALAAFGVAVAIGHHLGVGLEPLGDVGHTGTRFADWIDLLVPYLVVGTAAATLARAGTDRRGWAALIVAAIVYSQGHGVHLAGNSINNAADGHVAHLWDEGVGHWIWYLGLSLLVAVLIRALPPLGVSVPAALLIAAAGFTWFDNTVEGGVPYLGIAASVLLGGYAWRRAVWPVAAAYGVALVLLIVFGIWQGGFPQFSELGWI